MALWGLGSSMLVFLAGIQGIDRSLYEAAEIDGANEWFLFWKITIPMLTPVIFFNLIIGIIGSFQVFTTAYIATQGGPNNATLFYVLYIYRQGWEFARMGYASALAWVLFIFVLLLTLTQFKMANRWVYYETGDAEKSA
jgi:multiple sugar transport system permease protein